MKCRRNSRNWPVNNHTQPVEISEYLSFPSLYSLINFLFSDELRLVMPSLSVEGSLGF